MDKEAILNTCRTIAPKGELFCVNKYKHNAHKKRKNCFELKKEGKLVQSSSVNKLLRFYRPEDKRKIENAWKKHEEEMRKINRKNCYTMIEWAKKDRNNLNYYLERFWEYKHLSWHYVYEI